MLKRVPVKRVRPFVKYLIRVHGGVKPAAQAIGLSPSTFEKICMASQNRQFVTIKTAKHLVDGVQQQSKSVNAGWQSVDKFVRIQDLDPDPRMSQIQ